GGGGGVNQGWGWFAGNRARRVRFPLLRERAPLRAVEGRQILLKGCGLGSGADQRRDQATALPEQRHRLSILSRAAAGPREIERHPPFLSSPCDESRVPAGRLVHAALPAGGALG